MQEIRRLGAYVVLALSMLLMQQGGLRHALQHSLQDGDGLPAHSSLCKDCLSYCANDDLITPSVVALLVASRAQHVQVASDYASELTQVDLGYHSRAPPHS